MICLTQFFIEFQDTCSTLSSTFTQHHHNSYMKLLILFPSVHCRSVESESDSDDYSIWDPPFMRPTISSILHSRSRSAVRRSFDDESLSASELDTSGKPPFVVRHVGLHCRVVSPRYSSCDGFIGKSEFNLLFSFQVTITELSDFSPYKTDSGFQYRSQCKKVCFFPFEAGKIPKMTDIFQFRLLFILVFCKHSLSLSFLVNF